MVGCSSEVFSKDVGSDRVSLDSAHAVTVTVDLNSGVAVLTPGGVPRVLDGVVGGGVADDSHSVVDDQSASSGIVDDTLFVVVEDGFTGSKSHGGRTTGDSSFHTSNRLSDDFGPASNFDASAVRLASSLFLNVRILGVSLDFVVLSIVKPVPEDTVVASLAIHVAVNDLLLGERHKLSALLLPVAFNGSNGGESPA